jgi:predicted transcriptional regulator
MKVFEVRALFDNGPAYIAAVQFEEVAAMLGGNALSIHCLGDLSFVETAKGATGGRALTEAEIKATITEDGQHLVSLEDGKKYKSLKRHLAAHGLTIETYRAKWGLPAEYPANSPAYSLKRRHLALDAGLGKKGEKK